MYEYCKTWLELKTDKRAVTALEYGLIAGVLVATIIVGFGLLGNGQVRVEQVRADDPELAHELIAQLVSSESPLANAR